MSFSHDRRGQSVVVGTVILFGFLILALSLYQVQFVPAENEEIEFEHSQQVEGEFLDLRNAVLQAGSTRSAQSTRIQLGERYPQRTFFLNPPPAAGTLQTTDTDAIEVNGQIGDGAHENVQAFWETDPQFNSTSIRYTSNYNEYRGAPQLVYEHSVVAAEFDDAVLFRSDQTVVRNDRISVTALSGDISETGVQAQSVDLRPISRSVRTVPITGDGGDVEIVLPTAVDNTTALRDRWATTLPGATVTEDDDAIRIALNGSETYRLGLSAVAVDGGGETEPAYIVPVGGTDVVAGDSIGVEVRDEYNNPVADVPVSIDDETFRTGDEGRVFTETSGDGTVDATINGGSESYEEVVFTVTSTEDAAGANRTFSTQWDETGPIDVPEGETRDLEVEITDRETGNPIEDARIDYSIARRSGSGTATLNPTTRENHDGTDTVEFDAGGAVEGDSYDAYVSAGDDVDRLRIDITEAPTPTTPVFDVRITDVNDPVIEGETLDVDYTVENTGGEGGTQNIRFLVDGEEINEREVTVASGDSVSDTFTYQTEEGDSPNVDLQVESENDTDTRTAEVNAPAQFEVGITNVNDPVTEGDDLNVDYTIENTGGATDTQTIELLNFNDQDVDSMEVTLDGGETTSGTFTWTTETGDAETDDITVRSRSGGDTTDSVVEEVTIRQPMADIVQYVDESGEDTDNNGRISFRLENEGEFNTTITGIRVDSTTDNNAERVSNDGGSEFSGANGELNLPSTDYLEIGSSTITDLDTNAEITQDTVETFRLEQFRRSNNNNRVNMNNNDVTITLRFIDGSTLSITLDNL